MSALGDALEKIWRLDGGVHVCRVCGRAREGTASFACYHADRCPLLLALATMTLGEHGTIGEERAKNLTLLLEIIDAVELRLVERNAEDVRRAVDTINRLGGRHG